MRKLAIFSVIGLIVILSGCGGSEPTFDGSSQEAAKASLAAMFPEDYEKGAPGDDMPPALEAYACAAMQIGFKNLFSEEMDPDKTAADMEAYVEEKMDKAVRSLFDGMTAADMEAYGVENGLIGCLQGLKELSEGPPFK